MTRCVKQENTFIIEYQSMREKKAKIQETFAQNLRENRRKCGFTQVQLAEKAEISTNYLAMVELARYIPRVEIIERLAKALNVEIYELFMVPLSPVMEMKKLQESLITDLRDIVKESVDEAFEQERKRQKKHNKG
jgi:transcriptional regulator with XRE-family HTH domain